MGFQVLLPYAGKMDGCIVGQHLANKKATAQRQHDELPKRTILAQ